VVDLRFGPEPAVLQYVIDQDLPAAAAVGFKAQPDDRFHMRFTLRLLSAEHLAQFESRL
jgi:hypothetical protein